jgi:hypothetical protein
MRLFLEVTINGSKVMVSKAVIHSVSSVIENGQQFIVLTDGSKIPVDEPYAYFQLHLI